MESKEVTAQDVVDFRFALNKKFGESAVPQDKFSQTTVSGSFGREILQSAILAFVFSMVLIVAYLAFRFDWRYAAPTIAALIHDLIITLGVYSITGREVTSATVAAVLTILGYSLYDTIIVFDRVRENERLLRRHTYGQIVNISLWETLTRSLNTSIITLLPIASLFIFGGDTLKDFAFALLIGIISGAYSSFFVASPLLVLLKRNEPEFEKRHRLRRAARDLPALEGPPLPPPRPRLRSGAARPHRRRPRASPPTAPRSRRTAAKTASEAARERRGDRKRRR